MFFKGRKVKTLKSFYLVTVLILISTLSVLGQEKGVDTQNKSIRDRRRRGGESQVAGFRSAVGARLKFDVGCWQR